MFSQLLRLMAYFLLALLVFHTLVRMIRYYYKFPIPPALVRVIDNPLRRRIQPPEATAFRHGIRPGMRVLEVGPGSGRYTLAAAQALSPDGLIVTIDIDEDIIQRLQKQAETQGVKNIQAEIANVYGLPYEDDSFDLIYMIAVINEIPDQRQAIREFHRVLKPDGLLVFSEIILDPDYPLAATLIKRAGREGFRLSEKVGNFFYYTLKFQKHSNPSTDRNTVQVQSRVK